MSGYHSFSYFYDQLTSNISYKQRAEYFDMLIKKHNGIKNLLLDLACGTGSLSEEFSRMGYDVIGVDASEEMLNEALDKKFDSGLNIQYLCQDMTQLDMFGTIDVTICALDSLNHLKNADDVQIAFDKVSLFCEPDGLFIFDVNTPYKHKNVLADNTFIYDLDDVFCVWQNSFNPQNENYRVDITLDIFGKNKIGLYQRYYDELSEIAFKRSKIEEMLVKAGFSVEAVYDFDSINPPTDNSEKLVFVARKS